MIKCGKKGLKINGNKMQIMVELTRILNKLDEEKALTREEIDECVKLSRMDAPEVLDSITGMMKEFLEEVDKVKKEGMVVDND